MSDSFFARYKRACLVEALTRDIDPDLALPTIWRLDDEIRPEINGLIQSYEQGLCHSVEFFESLAFILHRERS